MGVASGMPEGELAGRLIDREDTSQRVLLVPVEELAKAAPDARMVKSNAVDRMFGHWWR